MLQAALNGMRTRSDHPGVPIAASEVAADAAACVAAGVREIHVHPRDDDGNEALDAEIVDKTVAGVKTVGVPVGVTTGAWIEGDAARRRRLVSAWHEPDYASVNLSEPGALEIAEALLRNGIGVEAGVWTVGDALRLTESPLRHRIQRVLIEPIRTSGVDEALNVAAQIHVALDQGGVGVPRLQHGEGRATWPVMRDAVRRGCAVRIGFEDTLHLPDGRLAGSNVELVRAALEIIMQGRGGSGGRGQ
jgi:uncharacterized protein (DUF849 family)